MEVTKHYGPDVASLVLFTGTLDEWFEVYGNGERIIKCETWDDVTEVMGELEGCDGSTYARNGAPEIDEAYTGRGSCRVRLTTNAALASFRAWWDQGTLSVENVMARYFFGQARVRNERSLDVRRNGAETLMIWSLHGAGVYVAGESELLEPTT